MIYAKVQNSSGISKELLKKHFLKGLKGLGNRERVLLIPPEGTRLHGFSSLLTLWAVEYYKDKVKAILPSVGLHKHVTSEEINNLFPGIEHSLFVHHDPINDLITLGTVPCEFIEEVSEKTLSFSYKVQVNKLLVSGGFDLILSLSQVIADEVVGMANHTSNIYVGTGGVEGSNKSHYLGAIYGIERIIGKTNSPVAEILEYAHTQFASSLPIVFALSVAFKSKEGKIKPAALFMGDDKACFDEACQISQKVNTIQVDEPLKKVVVFLDPDEYTSVWFANIALYRTRMAIADGGELIIIAPKVSSFSIDKEINRLIKKFGYKGKDVTLDAVSRNEDLKQNLLAASHLINGSSEERFTITYASNIKEKDILSVGYNYLNLEEAQERYIFDGIEDGIKTTKDGQEYYYISNPALGLWVHESRF